MKLSMWIINDWLKEYHPVATIVEGAMKIEGVRFFSDSIVQNQSFVYVGKTDPNSEKVLIINSNDVISIHVDDVEEIFNKVLEAFYYYDQWDGKLMTAAKEEQPEQAMLSVAEKVLGSIFMIDLSLNVIAIATNYKVGDGNRLWDELILEKQFSLKTINDMKKSRAFQMILYKQNCAVYDNSYVWHGNEKNQHKKSLAAMVSYYPNGRLLAQVICGVPASKEAFLFNRKVRLFVGLLIKIART